MKTQIILRQLPIIALVLINFVCHQSYSQQSEANDHIASNIEQTLVAAPVVLKPNSKNADSQIGALGFQPSEQDPNSLDLLRAELMQRAQEEQLKHEKDGWLKGSVKRFTPESMTFFVAIGLVTFNNMWIKSHGDPLAMERHIQSLKDPIAHLSFYSFMAANGFYMHHATKNMDPITKQQMMRRLSYQGMAIGSLASSIVSDLGHSGKMCVDYWINGKNDAQSVEACNQAWKQWTVRNKAQQYFPQIIAMWASQAATELIDASVRRSFQTVTALSLAKKFLSKKFMLDAVHKINTFDVRILIFRGNPIIGGIRLAGKVTQFTMFVGVDHLMSPFTYRPLNNLLRPLTFDFDSIAINNFVNGADKINWDDSRLNEANKSLCTVHNQNCFEEKLIHEIENFGEQMQQWRDHLNSDAETDIAGWMELTKRLLNQIDYSYKFYKSFTSNLFETLNIGHRIQNKQLENSAATVISQFPFRKLPLYGVTVGDYKTSGGSVDDLYLLSTSELERKQKESLQNVAKKYLDLRKNFKGSDLNKLTDLLNKLLSSDISIIKTGLIDINEILGVYSVKNKENSQIQYSKNFLETVLNLRTELGNPYPVSYEFAGFSQAFAANTTYNTIAPEADFSLWSYRKKYVFNKESDLMTYKVFCGNSKSSLDNVSLKPFGLGNEVNLTAPQFDPPTLLKTSNELTEFCSSWRKTRNFNILTENLYGQNIGQDSMYSFFIKNFKYEAISDFRSVNKEDKFDQWWTANARQPIDVEFKNFDSKFKKLVEITKQNIFDQKPFWKWASDQLNQSKYLQKNIKDNLYFETQFYLQLITRALDKNKNVSMKDKYDYLQNLVKLSQKDSFSSVYQNEVAPAEITKLQNLLKNYINLILNDQVNFELYIKESKKIDTAINDILVLAGLKISSKSNPEQVQSEELPLLDLSTDGTPTKQTASSTGTENSEITYKDVENLKPNLRQKTIASAVKGLRLVESEIRRFIRMKIALSQSLEIDSKEFMDDFNKTNKIPKASTMGAANPFGQRQSN